MKELRSEKETAQAMLYTLVEDFLTEVRKKEGNDKASRASHDVVKRVEYGAATVKAVAEVATTVLTRPDTSYTASRALSGRMWNVLADEMKVFGDACKESGKVDNAEMCSLADHFADAWGLLAAVQYFEYDVLASLTAAWSRIGWKLTHMGCDEGWYNHVVRSAIAECAKELGDPFMTSSQCSDAAAKTFIKAVNDNKAHQEESPPLSIGLCRWTVLLSRNKANSREAAESAIRRLAECFSEV